MCCTLKTLQATVALCQDEQDFSQEPGPESVSCSLVQYHTGESSDEEEEDEDEAYEETPLNHSIGARDSLPDLVEEDGDDSDDSEGAIPARYISMICRSHGGLRYPDESGAHVCRLQQAQEGVKGCGGDCAACKP